MTRRSDDCLSIVPKAWREAKKGQKSFKKVLTGREKDGILIKLSASEDGNFSRLHRNDP